MGVEFMNTEEKKGEIVLVQFIGKKHGTGGPLLTLFFKTLEKQPCKQKTV